MLVKNGVVVLHFSTIIGFLLKLFQGKIYSVPKAVEFLFHAFIISYLYIDRILSIIAISSFI